MKGNLVIEDRQFQIINEMKINYISIDYLE